MSEEKTKNEKRYETEWSFSFENVGKSIDKALAGLGEDLKVESFSVPKGSAQSARIVVGGSIGRTSITALDAGSANLFEAEVAHLGEIEFTASEGAETVVTLRQKHDKDLVAPIKRALGQIGKRHDLYLRIRISPDLPVYLDLDGGVGPAEFDLNQLRLTGLEIDGSVGPVTVNLPTTAAPYSVKAEGGVGGFTINAPSTTHVRLDIEGGVGSTVLNIPADASMDVKLEGGVGGTAVNVAPGVALRLEAEGGIGGISVPKGMRQLKEKGDFVSKGGVWESEGFALSTKRVSIDYEGGVGGFRIKQEQVQIV
jgi:hypothetical protein